jgi:hypothetical protein
VRTSILFWSTISGIILGVFVDATLIGVALLFSAIAPGASVRLSQRWLGLLMVAVLAIIPLVSAVLGFLEGRLKAN